MCLQCTPSGWHGEREHQMLPLPVPRGEERRKEVSDVLREGQRTSTYRHQCSDAGR